MTSSLMRSGDFFLFYHIFPEQWFNWCSLISNSQTVCFTDSFAMFHFGMLLVWLSDKVGKNLYLSVKYI